jgi:hypothetical protein
MPKLREQLEASGCKIIDETEERIIVTCPRDLLSEGLKVEGAKNIQTKPAESEKEVTLVLEKE